LVAHLLAHFKMCENHVEASRYLRERSYHWRRKCNRKGDEYYWNKINFYWTIFDQIEHFSKVWWHHLLILSITPDVINKKITKKLMFPTKWLSNVRWNGKLLLLLLKQIAHVNCIKHRHYKILKIIDDAACSVKWKWEVDTTELNLTSL
jgi:hypothetical protein